MAREYFSLQEIGKVDGGVAEVAFRQAVERCTRDIEDRPTHKAPRKVILQMEMIPIVSDEGHLDSVNVQFQVKDTLPTRKSKILDFGCKAGGKLWFNPDSPTNSAQRTLDELEPEDNLD